MTIQQILQSGVVIGNTVHIVYFNQYGNKVEDLISFQGFNPRGEDNVAVFYEKDKKGLFGRQITVAPDAIQSIIPQVQL